MSTGYFRTPTVAAGTVIFVTEDDLWTVPLSGGTARRLTAGLGNVAMPRLSPDGSMVAFSSREEFHPEVYVMPADGGQPRRLTFLGGNATVVGWTPDGRVAFRSHTGRPFLRWMELFAVDPATGLVERLPFGLAHEVSYGPDGGVVLGRNSVDPARWKRYRGGEAGDLWVDATGSGTFSRLIRTGGNPAHPMWIGDRIYFVDDREGIGNIYSCTPSGRSLRRHTDHGEYYARFASSDGSTIVYQHAAELWALERGAEEPRRIDVDFASPRTQRNRKFVTGTKNLHNFSVHPEGHSVALEIRGRAVSMGLWEGAVHEHGASSGIRYRHPAWLPDGKRLVVISDEGGEEALEIHRGDGKRKRFASIDIGRAHQVAVAPAGNKVAIANHRNEVVVADLDAGTGRVVDRSDHSRIDGLAWSADGAWLAYSVARSAQTRSIALAEVAAGKVTTLTTEFRDVEPVFDPNGDYLYFISYRLFDPVVDAHFFDLGFPRGSRPYAIALRKDVQNPFVPRLRGLGEGAEGDGEAEGKAGKGDDKKAAKKGAKPAPLVIDLDGIESRIESFPVPEARYVGLAAIKGKVLMLSFPLRGTLGGSDDDETSHGGDLASYDFKEHKHETILHAVSDFALSGDGATFVYRSAGRLRAVRAGKKPEKGTEKEKPGRESGWLDLGRIRLSIDPAAEWRQMYEEGWRLMRDNFWTADLAGVDWERIRERYRPVVERVATRLEFSDLMWEMQGELGTSHCYEMGGDHRIPPVYQVGHLAADLAFDPRANLWRIEHIVDGDPWDGGARSSLAEMGVQVAEGDTILAVNGRAVTKETSPQSLLVHLAGQRVELRVGDRSGKKPRSVVVGTVADDTPARYREWVRSNRARVSGATKGKVGYLHVPNMGPIGYSEFHRSFLSETDRDALIVDVRMNGGGNVSQVLLEKLLRRRIGYDVPRWGTPEPYPSDSVLGPIVCLTDEHAGSDGDIFSHCFKLLGIGPLVGKRTWGGVVGIWPRHVLADGGWTTQPEFAFWFSDVGFGVENYGTDPDVEVDIAPHEYAAGKDPQLDRAIALVSQAMKQQKPALPSFGARPDRSLPALPPRATTSAKPTKPARKR